MLETNEINGFNTHFFFFAVYSRTNCVFSLSSPAASRHVRQCGAYMVAGLNEWSYAAYSCAQRSVS